MVVELATRRWGLRFFLGYMGVIGVPCTPRARQTYRAKSSHRTRISNKNREFQGSNGEYKLKATRVG